MTPPALPEEIARHEHAERAATALRACRAAGAALLTLRNEPVASHEIGTQLKTNVDQAAEGWVLGFLRATFPTDRFLAEEAYEQHQHWEGGGAPFWTIDALDGTRSFVEGYDGFCVQVAYVSQGQPSVGVVVEPAARKSYLGVSGAGSWRFDESGVTRLRLESTGSPWPDRPTFVDSTRPEGPVAELMAEFDGKFLECGSVGLKICRVAEGRADVFAKAFRHKLWDVAPATVVLREAGGSVGTWQNERVDYTTSDIMLSDVLATPSDLWPSVSGRLT